MTDNEAYITVMFEQMLDHFKTISEMFEHMQQQMKTFITKDEFHARWDQIDAIKMAVKETNKDVSNHEQRITKLERAS
jgi:hypothetical protein